VKIGIQTWGSHGDIRPFMALAAGLQRAGHDVTLAATCVDGELPEDAGDGAGFRFQAVSSPVIADRQRLERIGAAMQGERDAIRQTQIAIEQLLLPVEKELFATAERLCADNDLLIGHYFLYPLGAAAARHGRGHVSVALVHGAVPSAFQPPAGVPDLGRLGNRLAWWLARRMLNARLKKYSDRLRRQHGIAAARDLIDEVWASPQLTLLAISPTICTPQPDWPDCYRVCGALEPALSAGEDAVPEELRAFLSAGPAPAYMTFGSALSGNDPRRSIALLTQAAETASARAVIQAPRWRELGLRSSATVHYLDSAPHARVFPQCSLVVHHGGAGTSHAALCAGRPSVVVAHSAEQELWGCELQRLGVALSPIRRRSATADRIATAMRRIAQSDDLTAKAGRLAAQMAGEDGVASAVKLIGDRFAG